MSIATMTRVWDSTRQSGSDLVILLALADHAGDDGVCWPSVESLRARARLADERSVRRILRKLEQDGDIFTMPNVGRGHTNLYMVTVGMTQNEIATALIRRRELQVADAQIVAVAVVARRDGKGDISAQMGACVSPIADSEKGGISAQMGANLPPIMAEKGACMPPRTNTGIPLHPVLGSEREGDQPLPPSPKTITVKSRSQYMPFGMQLPSGYVPAGTGANAVQVYYERFRYDDPDARLSAVQENDLLRLCTDLDRLREVVVAYSRTTYKTGNVNLILDWYRTGVPMKAQGGNNGKATGSADAGGAGRRNGTDSRKPWANYTDPVWTSDELDRAAALLAAAGHGG